MKNLSHPKSPGAASILPRIAIALMLVLAVLSWLPGPGTAGAVALRNLSATVVSSDGLNLRASPNASAKLVRVIPNGGAIKITSTSGDWFGVTYGSSKGWVNSWYVRLSGTSSKVITRGNTSRKMVALTFDAGSDLGYTKSIIQYLEKQGIPATFGLTGDWINAYPDYAAWIIDDGFRVLNHTLKHYSYTGASAGSAISPAKRLAQLEATETLINGLGGSSKPYWRPPYGDYDAGVLRDVGTAGYSISVLWTIDTLGWDGLTASQITSRVTKNVSNGAIILMHVGSDSQDGVALANVVSALRKAGYSFGTVSQVIA